MRRRPGVAPRLPGGVLARPAPGDGRQVLAHLRRHVEGRFRVPAQALLGRARLVLAERRAVGVGLAGLVGRAVADGGLDDDDRGPRRLGARGRDRPVDGLEVRVAALDLLHVPAVGREARADVLAEGERERPVERHVVGVVEVDELAEPQVPRERGRLGRDALHQVAVGDQRVGRVVDDRVPRPVEARRQVALGHRHADRVGRALPERAGGGLDARRVAELRVPRRLAAPLPEALQVLARDPVAEEVQERVEQHAPVPGREHEAVAIGPGGIGRIVAQVPRPEHVRQRRRPHRHPGVPRVRLLDRVDRERAQGVDAEQVDRGLRYGHRRGAPCQGRGGPAEA